jgi:hypothetical protein
MTVHRYLCIDRACAYAGTKYSSYATLPAETKTKISEAYIRDSRVAIYTCWPLLAVHKFSEVGATVNSDG